MTHRGRHPVCAVAGVVSGAAMTALPGSVALTVAGLLLLGFASAPLFPLLTHTTADRVGPARADRAVGIQVAASKIGAAAVPAGLGLLVQHFGTGAWGPGLCVPAVLLAVAYGLFGGVRRP
ncbi:hypothetical protein [Streptomyces paludis]|uniref:MFS transporter n=1 Tax=Streptomyces paludis TaxID=2282738 RepID=A0A345HX35_9ACTN|nr:hypothetical protein [Streptomyces paludis]AXG81259.1 hypothetical protein DVK44_30195 [Streptomyces paludis]